VRLVNEGQDDFLNEAKDVLRSGLETARWITVDDTGARHKARNGYCTHIGNDHFAWFGTTSSKSRLNFLELLNLGDATYLINDAAGEYMRERGLPETVIALLTSHEHKHFGDHKAWMAHLEGLAITGQKVHPDPVRIATEGAPWGNITAEGRLADTVIVSDGAGQFNVGLHAHSWFPVAPRRSSPLSWVHAERLVHKLDASFLSLSSLRPSVALAASAIARPRSASRAASGGSTMISKRRGGSICDRPGRAKSLLPRPHSAAQSRTRAAFRSHLHEPHRLCAARSALEAAARPQGRVAGRARAPRHSPAHQRLGERHPLPEPAPDPDPG